MADVLALFLKFNDDSAVYGGSQYRHLTAEVCTIADDDTPRNLTGGYSETPGLDDLAVTAQLDNTSARSYGWTVEYRGIHSANTRRILAMAATMRRVARDIWARRGEPHDLANRSEPVTLYSRLVARTAAREV